MGRARLAAALLVILPAGARGFSTAVHESVTREALSEQGFETAAAEAILGGNLLTDKDEFTDPKAHFDNEQFSAGAARIRAKLEAALEALDDCNIPQAWEQLGRALHPVQDFFAHSNWVENHAPGDPIDFLRIEDPQASVACDAKSHKGILTSGYWPDDKRPSPEKCVHAELNKDQEDRPFHKEARARAFEETKQVVELFERAAFAKFSRIGAGEARYRLMLLRDGSSKIAEARKTCRPKPGQGSRPLAAPPAIRLPPLP